MKRFLSLCLIFAAFITRADLLEFNFGGTASVFGDGISGATPIRGLMIYDTVTTNFTVVAFYTNKAFVVDVSTNYLKVRVTGPRAKNCTILLNAMTTTDNNGKLLVNSEFFKGFDQTLVISSNKTFVFPPVLTSARSRAIVMGPHGGLVYGDGTFNLTYNKARTVADNNASLTMAQASANYQAFLLNHGYHSAQ